jgi:hypothetical protein
MTSVNKVANAKIISILSILTLIVCVVIIVTPAIYNAVEGQNASPHYAITEQPFFKGAVITGASIVLMFLFNVLLYMIFSKKVIYFFAVVIAIIILIGAIIMIVDAYKQGMSNNTVYSVLDGLSYSGGGLGVIVSLIYGIINAKKLFK